MLEFRLLALSLLQQDPGRGLTRYRLMKMANALYSALLPPYSVGAFYHEMELMQRRGLITIHEGKVYVTDGGIRYLHQELRRPLPHSLAPLWLRVLAIVLLKNDDAREDGLKIIRLFLIKHADRQSFGDKMCSEKELWLKATDKFLAAFVHEFITNL
ncbi:MAG: hypothetical protein N2Z22_02910 [Turneriella sp.]|nr:hypothetical protein [Turneriella sp.]